MQQPMLPIEAALDDALATLRYLRRTSRVVVCGDSAGGGLAMAVALSAPHDIVGVVALSGLFDLTASTGSYDKRVDPLFSDAPDEERRSTIRDGLTYLGREPRDKDVNSVLTAAWCCYPPKLTKFLKKRKAFAQLEDFNTKRDEKAKKYNEEYMRNMAGK